MSELSVLKLLHDESSAANGACGATLLHAVAAFGEATRRILTTVRTRMIAGQSAFERGFRHTAHAIGITPTALHEFITDETRMPFSRTRSKMRAWLRSLAPDESESGEDTPTQFLGAARAFYGSRG